MKVKKLGIATGYNFSYQELVGNNVVSQGWEHDVSFLYKATMQEINKWLPIFAQTDIRSRNAFRQLLNEITEGDIILAFEGNTLKGLCEIPKNFVYYFDDSLNYPNCLFPVEWVDWNLFCQLPILQNYGQGGRGVKGIENAGYALDEIKKYIEDNWENYKKTNSINIFPSSCLRKYEELEKTLESRKQESRENLERIKLQLKQQAQMLDYQYILQQKPQIILQGAPGTGKTHLAEELAYQMILGKNGALPAEKEERKKALEDLYKSEQFALVQFHPAYSYEDFVRGIVAKTQNNTISYEVQNKILAETAKKAKDNPDANYILIIDEINRANLPAVLGELIYALEYRDKPVNSLYEYEGNREIILPSNLYIIGTMNTADRSVGHIDYAIRRRFAFVDVLPDKEVVSEEAKHLFKKVCELFIKNYDSYESKAENPILERSEYLASDFRPEDIMIGHSYFILKEKEEQDRISELRTKLQYEIKPLLKEYLKDGILLEKARETIEKLSI